MYCTSRLNYYHFLKISYLPYFVIVGKLRLEDLHATVKLMSDDEQLSAFVFDHPVDVSSVHRN